MRRSFPGMGLVALVTVLAFAGGRGTEDCVRKARAAGIPVETVE